MNIVEYVLQKKRKLLILIKEHHIRFSPIKFSG